MKKIIASIIAALSITSAQAEIPTPIQEKKSTVTWHPTAVAIGAIAGGVVGGVGAVVVGALVGEASARIIKKKQLEQEIERLNTVTKTETESGTEDKK